MLGQALLQGSRLFVDARLQVPTRFFDRIGHLIEGLGESLDLLPAADFETTSPLAPPDRLHALGHVPQGPQNLQIRGEGDEPRDPQQEEPAEHEHPPGHVPPETIDLLRLSALESGQHRFDPPAFTFAEDLGHRPRVLAIAIAHLVEAFDEHGNGPARSGSPEAPTKVSIFDPKTEPATPPA